MAVTKINARDWTFELGNLAAASTTWTQIGGVTSFSVGRSSQQADTADFDSGGVDEHEVMSRGRTITVEGLFLEDPATGARDAGQSAVETLADATGDASLKQLRITSPGGTILTQKVSAELGTVGGGRNAKTSWSVTFTRSGATTAV